MIRGISFTTNHQTGDILRDLLSETDAHGFYWHIIPTQTEAMDSTFESDFFKNEYYEGEELLKCDFHNSYIIFLKLEAYTEKGCSKKIATYADFLMSDCQILILIYDCENVEVYAKSPHLLRSIEGYLQKCHCSHFNLITDENDTRTKMNVL